MAFFEKITGRIGHGSPIRRALQLRWPLGLATITLAVIGLSSGLVDTASAGTHPLAALSLIGLGIWTLRMKRHGRVPLAQVLIVGLVLMVSSVQVITVMMAPWFGGVAVDPFGAAAARVPPFELGVALALGAFAAAALLRHGLSGWGTAAFLAGLFVTYTLSLQWIFGAGPFAQGVAAISVAQLVCLSGAMVSVYVDRPMLRVVFLTGDMGHQTRVVVGAALAIPLAVLCGVWPMVQQGAIFVTMVAIATSALVATVLATTARLEGSAVTRRQAEREIAQQRRIDPLTNALNRFGMMETLDGAWLDYRTRGATFGLLLVDLDAFEQFTDMNGAAAGDDVLTRVAQIIHPHLRDTDALGRWGRSEFIILLRIKQESDIHVVYTRLRRALEDIRASEDGSLQGAEGRISASFGGSVFEDADRGPSDAVIRADMVLHTKGAVPAQTEARSGTPDAAGGTDRALVA